MKWIFTLFLLIPSLSFAVESTPAKLNQIPASSYVYASCNYTTLGFGAANKTFDQCLSFWRSAAPSWNIVTAGSLEYLGVSGANKEYRILLRRNIDNITGYAYFTTPSSSFSGSYICPPDGKPEFTIGPVDLNGSQVCQRKPKICMMGAIVRVTSDGKETCVPNCDSAAGLTHSAQYYFQAGPTVGSTAGEVACYGQCSIKTIGGGVQLASGAWTGSFTFTGANCTVNRPEPTVDSESDTSSNGSSTPVDNSVTSQDTSNALGQLTGAASSAVSTPVTPSATGTSGETTLKDVAKVVADAANAQVKQNANQTVATGKLMTSISKDIQNAVTNAGHGGGGASASLQAQGNGKLDGIKKTLDNISDKLDKKDETPFTPPSNSSPFWENVLPDSAFSSIKDKKDSSIQELKDLQSQFSSGLFQTDLTVSGQRPEYDITFNGQSFAAGTFVFDLLLNSGLGAIIFLIATLTAIYIITTRSK